MKRLRIESYVLAAVSIVLSIVAVGFSIYVFFGGRRRYKRDLFLKIHQLLIGEAQYRGRQLLNSRKFTDEADILSLKPEERRNISLAIGSFDTLGLYLRHGYLYKADVMGMWGDPALRAWRAAAPFIARRKRLSGTTAYPYFEYLVREAEGYLDTHKPGA